MSLFDNRGLRRHAFLAVKLGFLAVALAIIAAFSAYYTVRRSVAGRDVQVPNVTSLEVREAEDLLKKSGLFLELAAQRNDDRMEEGRILAQDPPPGSAIKPQRKVKVIVSLGNKVSAAPELRGLAARRAQITLQQQGTRLGAEIYVYSRREPENLVIAQDPLPGSVTVQDGRIALLVSRGAPERTYVMPELTGRTESEVVRFLTRAGLKQAPSQRDSGSRGAPGTIVGQDPEAGYPVRAGDLVTLTLAGEGGTGG